MSDYTESEKKSMRGNNVDTMTAPEPQYAASSSSENKPSPINWVTMNKVTPIQN